MNTRLKIGFSIVLIFIACFLYLKWKHDEPRRHSLQALQTLRKAVNSNDSGSLLNAVVLPQALEGRTAAEQTEFLRKALQDEISEEGLAVLKQKGLFGSLKELFPNEAEAWASQAGVKPEDCVAFKAERGRLRAEVVLVKFSNLNLPPSTGEATYRVVRCNNVKQLAEKL